LLEERLTITSGNELILKDSRIKSSLLLEVRFISKNERFLTKELAFAGGNERISAILGLLELVRFW
jgi:hypothetical protein